MIEQRHIEDRNEWLRWRTQDVTASDIGALAGVDEYRTALRVYLEKTGQLVGNPDNEAMRRGRWLEPAVLKAVADTNPEWEVKPAHVYLRDSELRIGATPDSFAIDPRRPMGVGNLQLKVVARPVFERDWCDGQVPLKYQLQTLTEAMLAEAEWCAVAALVIDTFTAELVVREIPRHPAAEDRIRGMVAAFWKRLAAGERPPADYALDGDLIKALHPRGGAPAKDFSTNNRMGLLCEEKLTLSEIRHDLEARLKAADAEICELMGDAERGELPDFNVSWKLQSRKEHVVPASESRVLRVTRRKAAAA
jgi:predicted phage-related endonuclease